MKTSKLATIAAVLAVTFGSAVASASDLKVVAKDQSRPTKLCVTAANGSTVGMVVAVQRSGWSMKFVRDNISCNGQSIGQFAAMYGSEGVQRLLPPSYGVKIIDLVQTKHFGGNIDISK